MREPDATVTLTGWPRLTWQATQPDRDHTERYWLCKERVGWSLLRVTKCAGTSHVRVDSFRRVNDLENYVETNVEPGAWPMISDTALFSASEMYEDGG